MNIKKELTIKWAPNEDSRYDYEQKMFVQGDKIIPTLSISILNGNIDKMFLIAHFYMPDGVTNIYKESKIPINGEKFEIPIPEAALIQKGEHNIVIGLKASNDDSTVYGPRVIRYEVLENKQLGNECGVTPQKAEFALDILDALSYKLSEAKGIAIVQRNVYTVDNVLKNTEVDTGVNLDNEIGWKKVALSLDTTDANNKPYTAYKEVHIYTLIKAKGYIITEIGSQSLHDHSFYFLSFWLDRNTNTIHYKVDWGSDVIAEGVDVIIL